MNKLTSSILSIILLISIPLSTYAAKISYGEQICKDSDYKCVTVKKGETWKSLFPNIRHREIVRRLNRMNIEPYSGQIIAVPKNLKYMNINDISPLPKYHSAAKNNRSTVIVDQSDLAWGAYDSNGRLVKWGPISGGKNYCPDTGSKCKTIRGTYKITSKRGKNCISYKFPIGKGGAPMPYCMFFSGGYALHGSYTVPGYNASHGCVRLFVEDAEWLSDEFTKTGDTIVIIQQ